MLLYCPKGRNVKRYKSKWLVRALILKIIKIENGAQYEGVIYDYFVTAQTLSGKIIKIHDDDGWSKNFKENDMICACVYAHVDFSLSQKSDFTGVIKRDECFENDFIIDTSDGTFSVTPHCLQQESEFSVGKTVNFNIAGTYCSVSLVENQSETHNTGDGMNTGGVNTGDGSVC